MVAIIDYGLGNLFSLANALEAVGGKPVLTSDPDAVLKAERVILPGVGAIAEAVQTLGASGMDETVREVARRGTPLLGVCLGMQLLCSRSTEDGEHEALGIIPADVLRLSEAGGLKVPHIGWNAIEPTREHPLLGGLAPGSDVYFVHSYFVSCRNEADVLAYTEYGARFASMIARDNVMGAQFHPEKSQFVGLKMLENFLEI
jgi:glutamine amidotransferase